MFDQLVEILEFRPMWEQLLMASVLWQGIGFISQLVQVPDRAKKNTHDLRNRGVAILHSSTITVLGLYRVLCTDVNIEGKNSLID